MSRGCELSLTVWMQIGPGSHGRGHGTIPGMGNVRLGKAMDAGTRAICGHTDNMIDAAAVNRALTATRLGGTVRHFAEVESTNDLALEAAAAGVSCGVWVADAQTAGRGRGGHRWHSPPGAGLYVTALFTPRLPASALELSLLAGLATWEAIREVSGLVVDIRWPNDLVTRGGEGSGGRGSRKLGGVLAETAVYPAERDRPATLRYAVIGIGINVAHREFPPELENVATSLFLEGWGTPDRQPLLISLLARMDRGIAALEAGYAPKVAAGGPQPTKNERENVLRRWSEASTWVRGKQVHVPEDGGYTGETAGLDPSGFLLVDGVDGVRRTVRSGGVRAL